MEPVLGCCQDAVMTLPSFPIPTRSSFADLAPTSLHLRAAKSADMAFLRRLYRQSRADELAPVPWTEAEKRDFCQSQFQLQHTDWVQRFPLAWFLIASTKATPVGRFYVNPGNDSFHIIDIGLLKAWRSKGLGTGLIQSLQHQAERHGLGVTLSVMRDNIKAQALYERQGFIPTESDNSRLFMRWTPAP